MTSPSFSSGEMTIIQRNGEKQKEIAGWDFQQDFWIQFLCDYSTNNSVGLQGEMTPPSANLSPAKVMLKLT